jgi:hypothetical protein
MILNKKTSMKRNNQKSKFNQKRPNTSKPIHHVSSFKSRKPLSSKHPKRIRSRKSTGRIFTNGKENSKSRYNSQRLNMNKKLRNAEADRKAYAEETVAVIKKQRTKLEFLQRENSVLKETLTQGLDRKFLMMGGVSAPQLMFREDEKLDEKYSKLIIEEEKKLKKIQSNIQIFEKQIGKSI